MRYKYFINTKAGKGKLHENIKSSIDEYFKESGGDCTIIITVKRGDEIIWNMTDVHRNKLMIEQIA